MHQKLVAAFLQKRVPPMKTLLQLQSLIHRIDPRINISQSRDIQLERQIRILSEIPGVGVVGGSYRNLSGHWHAGCYQATVKNYVLGYQDGYYHSRNSCMFCDHLQGPFVAMTDYVKKLGFDESISNYVIFEDFFLRVGDDQKLVMACPDAMYFMNDYSQVTRRDVWLTLAKKWQLNRVVLSTGKTHSFSCSDLDFRCERKVTKSFLLPVCCLELYTEALKFFKDFLDKHNVHFELDSGSVLGGVKFNGILPWDLDMDISILSQNVSIFGKQETQELFKREGYTFKNYEPPTVKEDGSFSGGFLRIFSPGGDIYIELWGMSVLTNPSKNFLPPELRKPELYTKANIRGIWVNTAYSPGFYSRGRYGREVLKHAQSWLQVKGKKNSWASYDSGAFSSCDNPKHHSCLDDFPGDGNLPFIVQ
ncbi:predicted protein [Nematostella vectensis]|uniref:Ribitol-5-phosphate transferase n=1 Tax=Nematostella vectensis TaxID=45351 RepID=A7SZW6_NEMVE|nr:predicted protein [Nematostella vectensis]|eukprot:XP_001622846.1 hypothetical protein NEMVEDRAFT_v1g220148 [Nematostella vectensis]